MVYTVTFNPALDYLINLNDFKLGKTNRSTSENINFGGKGINVSFILNELGIETTALGFIAGFTGRELVSKLDILGIKSDFIELEDGFTRINVKIKGESETEINAQGPKITETALKTLFLKLEKLKSNDTLVLAGSIPSTLPKNIYEQILEHLNGKGIRFVVDATGDLLLNTLKYKPFLIKPNRAELEELFNTEFKEESEIVSAARKLQEKGALNVIVSLGADGAVLVDQNSNVYSVNSFCKKVVSSVGAGDSMVAGFLAGFDKSSEYALKLASAAAAATASCEFLGKIDDIISILNNANSWFL